MKFCHQIILSLPFLKYLTVLSTVRIYRSIYVLIKTYTSIYEGVERERDSIDSMGTLFPTPEPPPGEAAP